MKMIPLTEFQRITQLSDRALIWLLNHREVEMEIDAKRGLMIAPDSVSTKTLVKAVTALEIAAMESKRALIVERLASIVDDGLDDIVDAALTRLLSKQG